jgi:hypothetical protein
MPNYTIAVSIIALIVAALFLACTDADKEGNKVPAGETTGAQESATASQQKRQEQQQEKDADEDEEGTPSPAAAPAEKPAPQQAAGQQLLYNFDNDAIGQLPAKFHSARTGQGSESTWVVMSDPTAPSKPNVVAQTSTDKTDYRFPLLIADEGSFKDLDLNVRFKAVSGTVDQAAGLVFRLKDPSNYYIVRANALEHNYRLYHVIGGRRQQFAGANCKVTSGAWHELHVEAAGNKITCYYDGVKKIEATDDTFKEAGKIGLWTKADSVTYFDDLKVTAK